VLAADSPTEAEHSTDMDILTSLCWHSPSKPANSSTGW
jgi:hypothetical protein